MCPVARCRHGPSPRSERLGTPNTPAIRSTRDPFFEASLVRICYGLPGCSPPWTDRTRFPWPTGDFYIQASGGSVALPAAGYDYNSNWTPLLAGLSPAGMAASLAAPDLTGHDLVHGLDRGASRSQRRIQRARRHARVLIDRDEPLERHGIDEALDVGLGMDQRERLTSHLNGLLPNEPREALVFQGV